MWNTNECRPEWWAVLSAQVITGTLKAIAIVCWTLVALAYLAR